MTHIVMQGTTHTAYPLEGDEPASATTGDLPTCHTITISVTVVLMRMV